MQVRQRARSLTPDISPTNTMALFRDIRDQKDERALRGECFVHKRAFVYVLAENQDWKRGGDTKHSWCMEVDCPALHTCQAGCISIRFVVINSKNSKSTRK